MKISLIIEGTEISGEDLVRLHEMEECRHESPRTWKPKEYLELQKSMNAIRKKRVNVHYITKEKL